MAVYLQVADAVYVFYAWRRPGRRLQKCRLIFHCIVVKDWLSVSFRASGETLAAKKRTKKVQQRDEQRKNSPNRIYGSLNTIYYTKHSVSSLLLLTAIYYDEIIAFIQLSRRMKRRLLVSQKKALRNGKWIIHEVHSVTSSKTFSGVARYKVSHFSKSHIVTCNL